MPVKKIRNNISLRTSNQGEVLSYFSSSKRNHFDSESRLYEDLDAAISQVDAVFTAHLTTYPFIAVHVACGNVELLGRKKSEIEAVILSVLELHVRQT